MKTVESVDVYATLPDSCLWWSAVVYFTDGTGEGHSYTSEEEAREWASNFQVGEDYDDAPRL
jgi:hypothetical protein